DHVMPRMSGPELARRLRTERPDLKIVFMSGYVDRGIEQTDSAGGAFLEKPFTPQALLGKVRELLGEGAAP
ncbi:MAG TPA: response regulator, partial [Planctomycetota bacterium]|nr:response regulator [Planctomycetota bacterium]